MSQPASQSNDSFQAQFTLQNSLFELPVKSRISSAIYLTQKDELEIIIIDHPSCKAAITLQGGHLIAWQPADQQPVIWLSNAAEFKTGKAIRGGVPVCWPWFGPQGKPSHGFARNQTWSLESAEERADDLKVVLRLTENVETLALWPSKFNLRIEFLLGKTCTIRLISAGEFSYTTALHSYFVIGDNHSAQAHNLGLDYIDTMNGDNHVTLQQATPAGFTERIDRVYPHADKTTLLSDPTLSRNLHITHQRGKIAEAISSYEKTDYEDASCDVVIWNPGPELSKSMADMADDSFKTMACVETGIISNPVTVNGDEHFVEVYIEVK